MTSTRNTEQSRSCSSRLKLGWLLLLLLMALFLYAYFSSSTFSSKLQKLAVPPDSSARTKGGCTTKVIATNRGFEKDSLIFGGNNEIAEGFADQNSVKLNVTESNSLLEIGSEGNSNSEFGVVFSEYKPSKDDFGAVDAANNDEVLSEVDMKQQEELLESDEMYNDTSAIDSVHLDSSPTRIPDHDTELKFPGQNGNTSLASLTPGPAAAAINHREKIFSTLENLANRSNPHCTLSTHFASWVQGIVAQVGKPIKRDCKKLRENDKFEVEQVKSQVELWKEDKPWEDFALRYMEMSCEEIKHEFENNFYVSETEKNFPLAYILVIYTNAGQIIRLLKSIYRPRNLYCIHPDAKQGQTFASFFVAIAKCLDNVFVASKPIRVYYSHHSIMDSQLHCMQDLVKYPETRWKHVINLCGREVPVKTNREIVESLQKLNGYTALKLGDFPSKYWNTRFKYKYVLNGKGHLSRTHKRQSKPPKGIKLYKSMNYIAASRAFVEFILNDPLSKKLQTYLSTVFAPEEHYYSSLYALPQAKGGRPPEGLLDPSDMPIVDTCIWVNTKQLTDHINYYCPGRKIVHGLCISSTPDLEKIEKNAVRSVQPVFFFNKYFLEWDPMPMECMEERIVRTNMKEYWHDCISTDRPMIF